MTHRRTYFARTRGHPLIWRLIAIAGTCAVAWLAGLLWFATEVPSSVAEPERITDAIVVLTGGSGRV
ncbi:MAG: YdcF family protein, partial [Kiloniellales bacterium]